MSDPDEHSERQINIHTSPEQMAGVYANFANVSHSDYEFTITFARVDHEVDDEEVPGVVVSRVNLSPRFMRELIDAMEDNYSKWATRSCQARIPNAMRPWLRARPERARPFTGCSRPLTRGAGSAPCRAGSGCPRASATWRSCPPSRRSARA